MPSFRWAFVPSISAITRKEVEYGVPSTKARHKQQTRGGAARKAGHGLGRAG